MTQKNIIIFFTGRISNMKKFLSITGIVCALYLIIVMPTFATQNEHGCQWKHIGREFVKVCPTNTPTSSPIGSPTDEPTATASATPTASPSASPSSTPESTVSATPTATPESAVRTDLSDNRSDGLGCGSHDCNTQKNNIQPTARQASLPSTGSELNFYAIIAGLWAAGGLQLVKEYIVSKIK